MLSIFSCSIRQQSKAYNFDCELEYGWGYHSSTMWKYRYHYLETLNPTLSDHMCSKCSTWRSIHSSCSSTNLSWSNTQQRWPITWLHTRLSWVFGWVLGQVNQVFILSELLSNSLHHGAPSCLSLSTWTSFPNFRIPINYPIYSYELINQNYG